MEIWLGVKDVDLGSDICMFRIIIFIRNFWMKLRQSGVIYLL